MGGKIGIALIGYGYWGKIILPYLDAEFDVRHVFGRSLTPEGRFTNDLDRIWKSNVAAVVVATPIDAHFAVVMDALRHGKHVLCEKPLALHSNEAKTLHALAQRNKLQLLTDLTYSFSPALQNAARLTTQIGGSNYISMQLMREVSARRRVGFKVNQLLASKFAHLLAVTAMFVPLDEITFGDMKTPLPGTGVLKFWGSISGELLASIDYPDKHMGVVVLGSLGRIEYSMETDPTLRLSRFCQTCSGSSLVWDREEFESDETNNLKYTAQYFRQALTDPVNCRSNVELSVKIVAILEKSCGLVG